jgi:hypothetical protein
LGFFGLPNASQAIINSGPSVFYGVIYAPNTPITINSACTVYGALAGSRVVLNSNCSVHYDSALGSACSGSNGTLLAARTLPTVKSPVAALPAGKAMIIGPNPVAGRAKALYRVDQPGAVAITVYDLAGSQVRSWQLGEAVPGVAVADLDFAGLADGLYLAILTERQGTSSSVLGQTKIGLVRP